MIKTPSLTAGGQTVCVILTIKSTTTAPTTTPASLTAPTTTKPGLGGTG